jgi:hypothetical protein
MKTPADLREVRLRLEKSAALLPGEPTNATEKFQRLESIGIAILDSEFNDFPPGVLECYLSLLLEVLALECGTARTDETDASFGV